MIPLPFHTGGVKAPISVKVTSSGFTSAQVTIYREKEEEDGEGEKNGERRRGQSEGRGYELYYRISSGSGEVSGGGGSNEWQVKPIFFSSARSTETGRGEVGGSNETIVLLDNLICGTTYHVHVVDLESGSRSETITFRTQGSGKLTQFI